MPAAGHSPRFEAACNSARVSPPPKTWTALVPAGGGIRPRRAHAQARNPDHQAPRTAGAPPSGPRRIGLRGRHTRPTDPNATDTSPGKRQPGVRDTLELDRRAVASARRRRRRAPVLVALRPAPRDVRAGSQAIRGTRAIALRKTPEAVVRTARMVDHPADAVLVLGSILSDQVLFRSHLLAVRHRSGRADSGADGAHTNRVRQPRPGPRDPCPRPRARTCSEPDRSGKPLPRLPGLGRDVLRHRRRARLIGLRREPGGAPVAHPLVPSLPVQTLNTGAVHSAHFMAVRAAGPRWPDSRPPDVSQSHQTGPCRRPRMGDASYPRRRASPDTSPQTTARRAATRIGRAKRPQEPSRARRAHHGQWLHSPTSLLLALGGTQGAAAFRVGESGLHVDTTGTASPALPPLRGVPRHDACL